MIVSETNFTSYLGLVPLELMILEFFGISKAFYAMICIQSKGDITNRYIGHFSKSKLPFTTSNVKTNYYEPTFNPSVMISS